MTDKQSTHLACDETPLPKLILLGRDGMGLLKLSLADGSIITVRLFGRHVRILLALNDALHLDEDVDEAARGWMDDELIAEAYGREPLMIPPSPQAVAAYRAQINRRIRQQTPPGHRPPKLFLSERCVGVRLAHRIVVVDLVGRHKASSACPPCSS